MARWFLPVTFSGVHFSPARHPKRTPNPIPRTNILLGELLTSFLLTGVYLGYLADSEGPGCDGRLLESELISGVPWAHHEGSLHGDPRTRGRLAACEALFAPGVTANCSWDQAGWDKRAIRVLKWTANAEVLGKESFIQGLGGVKHVLEVVLCSH